VRLRGLQKGAVLFGRPDTPWLGGSASRKLRSFGRIDGEKLIDVNGVRQRLP
jgi:hypothetical protein